ncbi:molybdopterin-dependent oxidoreductase [Albirhodobacter sp. R86504]|uniref:molybdopterin-dependent oxidoreductase n=1 Tax=Albirhodobacter sp. R86504 TaxID=3093848 RepID=UPI00366CF5EC
MFSKSFLSVLCVASVGVVLWVGFPSASAVTAQELSAPEGPILLTVTGNIKSTNAENAAVFDLAMLEALPMVEFETTTVWTEGTHTFQGVALKDLIDILGVEGETLHATAVNDYGIDIPVSEIEKGGATLAYRMDGKTMSLRDKGPLWIVYPYDSEPAFRSEVIYSRSIWQLDRIDARD